MLNLRPLTNDLIRVKYKIGINAPIIFLLSFLHNKHYLNISERYIYGF